MLTDFSTRTPDLGWFVVNDTVMGGRSEGEFAVRDEQLHFTGRTNTRGGGFSSIRSAALALDLSRHDGIRLRVRADGRRYSWQLRTSAQYYGRDIAYWADFETEAGEWQIIDIPFSRFVPKFRGTVLPGPSLNTGDITGMGLMIYDNRDGAFALQMDSVQTFIELTPFSLQSLQWKKRVLLLSAPDRDDPTLGKQLAAIVASRSAFAERDLVLVVLLGNGTSTADDKPFDAASADEIRDRTNIDPETFSVTLIGKDGSVKSSNQEYVPMEQIYALIDGMPMRRREMTER
ncbi:MAG: CIA30 family protein [Pseudomonadota bacterium]